MSYVTVKKTIDCCKKSVSCCRFPSHRSEKKNRHRVCSKKQGIYISKLHHENMPI